MNTSISGKPDLLTKDPYCTPKYYKTFDITTIKEGRSEDSIIQRKLCLLTHCLLSKSSFVQLTTDLSCFMKSVVQFVI